jgi:hypothetical protein
MKDEERQAAAEAMIPPVTFEKDCPQPLLVASEWHRHKRGNHALYDRSHFQSGGHIAGSRPRVQGIKTLRSFAEASAARARIFDQKM